MMSYLPVGSDRVLEESDSEMFFTVKMRYFGSVRASRGIETETYMAYEGQTLGQLLLDIASKHNSEFCDEILLKGTDSIRNDLMITLNGVILNSDEVSMRIVQVEDIVSLFPIFPGGG
ncbi:MAG: MoaD/ThiS family protein [Oscillospiraceae bacterium]|nr:MoaD/ThiS family protein [Oscillospiraceae bacterium]